MKSSPPTDEERENSERLMEFFASASPDDEDFCEQIQANGFISENASPHAHLADVSYDELEENEKKVADAMLETLCEILALDDERCQQYALHGMGHLHHPQVRAVVQAFIDKNSGEWDEDALRWVESCRDGTVM